MSHDARDLSMHIAHALRLFAACSQVSLKSSACPGRDGKNLKVNDFKYGRKTYWLTSREAQDVLWMEDLMPSSEIVKAYVAHDKSYATTDACYLDAGDSFDSFLDRWKEKTLIHEYGQVPLKTGAVGNAYPHGTELQDLITETKDSEVWKRFIATGEQDLDGFEGEGEDEVRALRACCHCAPTCTHVHPPMCACVCSPIGALMYMCLCLSLS